MIVGSPWSESFPPSFDVGTPGGGHIHFANDGSITLYANDGVTKVLDITPGAGLRIYDNGGLATLMQLSQNSLELFGGSFISGSLVAHPGIGNEHSLNIVGPFRSDGEGIELRLFSGTDDGTLLPRATLVTYGVGGVNQVTYDSTGKLTAGNLALVSDGLIIPVTVLAGNSSATSAATAWPKGLFTNAPIVGTQVVSGSGLAINADVLVTAVSAATVTVQLKLTANVASNTTFNVHVKGDQYT